MPYRVITEEDRGDVNFGGCLPPAARASGGAFVVTAPDEAVELGGFAVAAEDVGPVACLDERLDWLTDSREIGHGEWVEDPSVFLRRARVWNERVQ